MVKMKDLSERIIDNTKKRKSRKVLLYGTVSKEKCKCTSPEHDMKSS